MTTLPPRFKIILTNPAKERLALSYQLLDTPAALIWFDCVKNAISSSLIKETRLYHFPNRGKNSLADLLKRFQQLIENLSAEFPEILNHKIDSTDLNTLQKSMNSLHQNFAHNHLIEMRVSQSNLENWHEFNSLIHQIENEIIVAKHPIPPDQITRMRIEFEWEIPFEVKIPESCYREFSLLQDFGDLNIIYCDVGRHLFELYHAQDQELPAEHIRPHRHFSANTGLHFGYTVDANIEDMHLRKIHNWFKLNENKFNEAGVFWDNPNRALGSVRAAKLLNAPNTTEEKKEFQKILSNYNQVVEVQI